MPGYKDVSFRQRFQKWRATISCDGKRRNLEWFDSAEEAYVAYCNAAQEHYNGFRWLLSDSSGTSNALVRRLSSVGRAADL